MRIFVCISVFLISFFSVAQNVLEYNITNNLIFKVYGEEEGKMFKISKEKDFKQNTPEAVALSSSNFGTIASPSNPVIYFSHSVIT